jgi:hypothetical protein
MFGNRTLARPFLFPPWFFVRNIAEIHNSHFEQVSEAFGSRTQNPHCNYTEAMGKGSNVLESAASSMFSLTDDRHLNSIFRSTITPGLRSLFLRWIFSKPDRDKLLSQHRQLIPEQISIRVRKWSTLLRWNDSDSIR